MISRVSVLWNEAIQGASLNILSARRTASFTFSVLVWGFLKPELSYDHNDLQNITFQLICNKCSKNLNVLCLLCRWIKKSRCTSRYVHLEGTRKEPCTNFCSLHPLYLWLLYAIFVSCQAENLTCTGRKKHWIYFFVGKMHFPMYISYSPWYNWGLTYFENLRLHTCENIALATVSFWTF